MKLIKKYFPDLTQEQSLKFQALEGLYQSWNEKINVISRKDFEHLYERHILHSLGIAKVMQFKPGTKVLDVGTGGGFPGIPLAILFPETSFTLIDSIGKKIKVVSGVAEELKLDNVNPINARAETVNDQFHFVVSRAVTRMAPFYLWIKGKFQKENFNELPNGILYLKGGELEEELRELNKKYTLFDLDKYFEEEFFQTKKVVYIPFQ